MIESFIERQFPVSKISKESYKERKAGRSQTLTGLGNWWGRKPLILVRAAIIGALMPASDNPAKDMEIFQKILAIDKNSLRLRKEQIPINKLYTLCQETKELIPLLNKWFDKNDKKIIIKSEFDKNNIEDVIFSKISLDKKLNFCIRPEKLDNLSQQTWREINHHLGTNATNLSELIEQLSQKRFGKKVVIGDCFAGGGSIPFEAARIGCDVYASDLNPIAGLLTWADINICGSSDEEFKHYSDFLHLVYDAVDKDIDELGIEKNDKGERALTYFYCLETRCPECGKLIPLISNPLIGKQTNTIVKLVPHGDGYNFDVEMHCSPQMIKEGQKAATLQTGNLVCPHCHKTTPLSSIRKATTTNNKETSNALRKWSVSEFDYTNSDIYHDRLYAIQYLGSDGNKYYSAPSKRDEDNEEKIRKYLLDNIQNWQKCGFIAAKEIEPGDETTRLPIGRGWMFWHQLFSPRQLLTNGLFIKNSLHYAQSQKDFVLSCLAINKVLDWNSNLCGWNSSYEKTAQTFYNQALNPMINHTARGLQALESTWFFSINKIPTSKNLTLRLMDARDVVDYADFWITDPPYADAVNYHELSEYFLSWDKVLINKAFPDWYTDSKRILAVKGDESFFDSMVSIYSNLTKHMPDDGIQIVMFTHSDVGVWAQLALIMWKSGLKVTAAWNIVTETESGGLKTGNYVQGTVLLVLRKQTGNDTAYLDEINADIKYEVKKQIESMQELDDKEEPNFSDPDYVLAAYAASLKVLTSYKNIGGINIEKELDLAIKSPTDSKIVKIIENAKKTAYDCLIPLGFNGLLWKDLNNAERFYIKCLEAEKAGDYQVSTYQEYARGFSLSIYKPLMANEKANLARLKTPAELAMREIKDVPGFEESLLRKILAAIYVTIKEEEERAGLEQIKNTVPDYWNRRDLICELLSNLKETGTIENMPHWKESAEIADHLQTLVANDHI